VLGLATISNLRVATGRVLGDDEAIQLTASRLVMYRIEHWDGFTTTLRGLAGHFLAQDQPPLRYLMSIPGLLIFGDSEIGLRFVAVVISLLMTVLVMRLGSDLAGKSVGIGAGLLVAVAPIYNWTSMAFGWSVIVAVIVQSLRELRSGSLELELPEERRRFHRVNALLFIAFLVNTTMLIFLASTLVLYLSANHRSVRKLVRQAAPWLCAYGLYYLWFFGTIPAALGRGQWTVGQLTHTRYRSDRLALTTDSLVENLRMTNAYLLPYLGCALVVTALVYMIRKERRLLCWIAPFPLLWSFVFTGSTGQYFVLFAVSVMPFAVAQLFELPRRAALSILAVTVCAVAAWNYEIFLRSYSESAYPTRLLRRLDATVDYPHNIRQPFDQLKRDLRRLGTGSYLSDTSGSLFEFYLNDDHIHSYDSRYRGTLTATGRSLEFDQQRNCFRLSDQDDGIKTAITSKTLCPEGITGTITYPGSTLKVYELAG
jgi:hypothetical protein